MIQRIQTIFLLLATLSVAALFLQPMDLATIDNAAGIEMSHPMLADKVFDIQDMPALMGLTALAALIPLVAVFLFKNRKLQIKIDGLGMVVTILLMMAAAYFFFEEYDDLRQKAKAAVAPGAFLPLLNLLFLMLANRFIRKDERLVRSADRLR